MRDLKADLEWLISPSKNDGKCIDDPDVLDEYIKECNKITTICEHALERAIEAEALARELADMLGRVTPRYLAGRLELDLDMVYEANRLIAKAKEVPGDE